MQVYQKNIKFGDRSLKIKKLVFIDYTHTHGEPMVPAPLLSPHPSFPRTTPLSGTPLSGPLSSSREDPAHSIERILVAVAVAVAPAPAPVPVELGSVREQIHRLRRLAVLAFDR